MVIAIDGPAGAGKSTVARGVGEAHSDSLYLDSGAMYRCVALAGLDRGVDVEDGEVLGESGLGSRHRLRRGHGAPRRRPVEGQIRTPAVTIGGIAMSQYIPAGQAGDGEAPARIDCEG